MLFYIHGYQGACPLKLMNFGIFKYRQKTNFDPWVRQLFPRVQGGRGGVKNARFWLTSIKYVP